MRKATVRASARTLPEGMNAADRRSTKAVVEVTAREKADLLRIISERIEQRARLESELGVDLRTTLGLPRLEDLRRGLAILQRELANHQTTSLALEEART
jgi:hypothetical protein